MHGLIAKLLQKKKINDIRELTPDEKETFDKWDRVLSEGEMTIEKILEFCKKQIKIIEGQYINPDNSEKKDIYLKASLSVYTNLTRAIKAPKAEKEALEKYLNQLIQ